MFLRLHRIGESAYYEVLESYRDPTTGKPKHRLVVRWKAEQRGAQPDDFLPVGADVRKVLWVAKVLRRRAVIQFNSVKRGLAECKWSLANPDPSDPDAVPYLTHCLANAERGLPQAQRKLAMAERFLAGMIEAEAGLVRSGRLTVEPVSDGATAD